MVLGLCVAGGALFALAYLALRPPGIDRKRDGLRAANRVPLDDATTRRQPLRVVDRG